MEYNNKLEYLDIKLKDDDICTQYCDDFNKIYQYKKYQCGVCFWKDVILPHNMIPECSRCKRDMINFREQLKLPETKIKLQNECFSDCLWWDWFDNRRKILAKESSKEIIYIKKNNINHNKSNIIENNNINNNIKNNKNKNSKPSNKK